MAKVRQQEQNKKKKTRKNDTEVNSNNEKSKQNKHTDILAPAKVNIVYINIILHKSSIIIQ